MGRSKGSRNKGYFYSAAKKGWFTKNERGRFVPLCDEDGERLRDEELPEEEVKLAYARWLVDAGKAKPKEDKSSVTVWDVCQAYLAHAKNDRSKQTENIRNDALYDFATGFPPKFRRPKAPRPTSLDRIHSGYGEKLVSELRPLDLDRWLQAHPEWEGGKRTKIQAVKRAFNYAVEAGLVERNPFKGYKAPKVNSRATYITDEQEKAMLEDAPAAFATAIRVLIRTGARPGLEFAPLTAAHVRDHGDRMEWVFAAKDSKNKRPRVIRITDPDIIKIVRAQMERHKSGPLFRNARGTPWTRKALTHAFDRLRECLRDKGIELDKDACLYSFRHTYAKRTLQGYWNNGKVTNIETLARLMGNTPEVCRDHYLQWCDHYAEPLWEAC